MKLAVYTICKNEEKFVERFMDCLTGEADQVIVTDTGSTDKTVQALQDHGARVHQVTVQPWRFDDARNASLNFVPLDYEICVCIDLDEVLTEGWSEKIKQAWTPETNRLRYQYIWSHHPDGSPATTFWYDKIHRRDTHRWVHPVHEVLQTGPGITEVQTFAHGFELHHWPDASKSRSSYLPLLALSVREKPNDDRNSHYYGRELMFYQKYDEAITELKRHLSLPTAKWEAERAASMRFIGRCYKNLGNLAEAERWYLRAAGEAPGEREPWVELARVYYDLKQWANLASAAERALSIKERPMSYICEPGAWGSDPHDLAALGCWYSGRRQEALAHAKNAVAAEPNSERLQRNVKLMESQLQSTKP